MHTFYELETEIPANHQLTIELSDNIPFKIDRDIFLILSISNFSLCEQPPLD